MAKVRILFVGEMASSHLQNWISLLENSHDFDVCAVSTGGYPADKQWFPIYAMRKPMGLLVKIFMNLLAIVTKPLYRNITSLYEYGNPIYQLPLLLWALLRFRPHIVHTYGFVQGAMLFFIVPRPLRLKMRWIVHILGGSDVVYSQFDEKWKAEFQKIIPQASVVLADNYEAFRIINAMGVPCSPYPALPLVPGTGGINFSQFLPPIPLNLRENSILWGKAYECRWSKSFPVIEALQLFLQEMQEKGEKLRVYITATDNETRQYISSLPSSFRQSLEVYDRLSHAEFLEIMQNVRVVLAPTLVDGIPNTLYEAMASGCIPIVSQLPSFSSFFIEGVNVFYAANLYPHDILRALRLAFDDSNCKGMQEVNLLKVRMMADRKMIRAKMLEMYKKLAC